MRRSLFVVAVSALLTSAVQARTVYPVEAKLVVPYTHILPGVPFEMWVDLYNPSEFTVHVAVCLPLGERPEQGRLQYYCDRTCTTKMEERGRRRNLLRNAEVTLAPGERKTMPLPIRDPLDSGELFDETVLSVSHGHTLLISLRLCFIDWPENMSHPATIKPAPHFDEPLVTNEVAVEILEPSDSDAKVWERMLSSNRAWTPYTAATVERSFWDGVLTDFPDSNYVPYALLAKNPSGVDWNQDLSVVLAAIRRFPDSPVIDLLHMKALRFATALRLDDVVTREETILDAVKRPTILALRNRE